MKPYTITVELKPMLGKPPREHTYELYAEDRDDMIDFIKRVHRVDFKRVVSCRQASDGKSIEIQPEDLVGYPQSNEEIDAGITAALAAVGIEAPKKRKRKCSSGSKQSCQQ